MLSHVYAMISIRVLVIYAMSSRIFNQLVFPMDCNFADFISLIGWNKDIAHTRLPLDVH